MHDIELNCVTEPPNRVKQASDLVTAGQYLEAIALLRSLPPHVLARTNPQRLLARACLATQQYEAAAAAIDVIARNEPDALPTLRLKTRLQRETGDKAALEATLRATVARTPDDAGAKGELAQLLIAKNAFGEALPLVESLEQSADRHLALGLRYELARHDGDLKRIAAILTEIAETCENLPPLPELDATLAELPQPDATALQEAFLEKWPEQIRWLKASAKPSRRRQEPPRDILQIMRMHQARFPEVAADVATWIADFPPTDSLRRPLAVDDGGDVVISPPGVTGTTLLVFTGLDDLLMGAPLESIDPWFARAGHAAVYARDPARSLYIGGIAATGSNLNETLSALDQILKDLGTTQLYCLSASAGSFGAIRYAPRLGAKRVLCASPALNATPAFLSAVGDQRGLLVARRLQRRFSHEALDLRPDIAAAQGACDMRLWYGAQSPVDRAHAQYVEDQPGVTLFPISDLASHVTLPHIVASGAFQRFLEP